MSFKLSILVFFGVLFSSAMGCKRSSDVERAMQRLVGALERGEKKVIWAGLAKESQVEWGRIAKRSGVASGDKLFLSGRMWQVQRLRRNYKKPIVIKGKKAWVACFDELSRPIRLHFRKEEGRWKFVLSDAFLGSGALSRKTPSSASTKPAVR